MMDFGNPHFAEPQWLWLAVLAPLFLAALQRYSAWARRRQLAQLADPQFIGELIRSHSPARRRCQNLRTESEADNRCALVEAPSRQRDLILERRQIA